MKRIFSVLLAILLLGGMAVPTLPVFAANMLITQISIYGIDTPIIGEKPDYTVSIDSETYTVSTKYDNARSKNGVTWSRSDPNDLNSAYLMEPGVDTFEAGYVYSCSVVVKAKDGYVFDAFDNLIGQIDGMNADVSYVTFEDTENYAVSLRFEPQKKLITKIEITALETPVAGEKPDMAADVKTAGCVIDSISWMDLSTDLEMSKNDTFKAGRNYRVSILVSAKENYQFGANLGYVIESTVNGEDAYNREESGKMLVECEWEAGAHICRPEKVNEVKATCTTSGKKAYYACTCGRYYEDAAGEKPITALSSWGVTEKVPHTPGDGPTEEKAQTCTDCGAVLVPAKNHTHTFEKVPRQSETCSDEGVYEHYFCKGCGGIYRDSEGKEPLTAEEIAIPPHGHSGTGEFVFDETQHWFICIECGSPLEDSYGDHIFNEDPDACVDCGYLMGTDPDAPQNKDEEDGDPFRRAMTYVVPAAVVVAGGAAGTAVFIRKRKIK